MKVHLTILAFILCIALPYAVKAQDSGTIDIELVALDSVTGEYVPNARFLLLKDGEAFREGMTNDQGKVIMKDVPEGEYIFEITCEGHIPREVPYALYFDQPLANTVMVSKQRDMEYVYIDGIKVRVGGIKVPKSALSKVPVITTGVPFDN